MEHSLAKEGDMIATHTQVTGSAERWGPAWGARPGDWAETEAQQVPTYEEGFRQVGLQAGQRVLDVGCGTGVALRVAADRGARVSGLDASEALARRARERVPEADIRVGDMESLPFGDDAFDLVTGFNSFFFASDIVSALREARRVAKPGGSVLIQVWGPPDQCDLTALKHAVAPFLPPAPASPPLSEPGVLEALASEAGLAATRAFDTRWAYTYADEEAMARGMMSAAYPVMAVALVGEERVRRAVVEALEPYRLRDGSYRFENEWHYLQAVA
jgi:SAM-dependent methyltransferase